MTLFPNPSFPTELGEQKTGAEKQKFSNSPIGCGAGDYQDEPRTDEGRYMSDVL